VAKFIDSIHTEFICTYEQGRKIIRTAIYNNESYDQTTIRASCPMTLALQLIKEKHPEMAVIYSGELSDELFMGYFEWKFAPNVRQAKNHVIRRCTDVSFFDGNRADRTISSVGCELRLPFFGKSIFKFIFSLPPEYLMPVLSKTKEGVSNQNIDNVEKYLLRRAFTEDNEKDMVIPKEILWRTKHAFSDASSVVGKTSWKEYLKHYAEKEITDSRFHARSNIYPYCTPRTKEDFLYREIFDEFNFDEKIIPYFWAPEWAPEGLNDSSATELPGFKETIL